MIFKMASQVSVKQARQLLAEGAVVVDVRTPEEFAGGHLPQAINIPLDQIEARLPERIAGKFSPILLHCASGMRSGTACDKLKAMGYTNAHNLGSYARAVEIVEQTA